VRAGDGGTKIEVLLSGERFKIPLQMVDKLKEKERDSSSHPYSFPGRGDPKSATHFLVRNRGGGQGHLI